jgi:glutathione peroxidase
MALVKLLVVAVIGAVLAVFYNRFINSPELDNTKSVFDFTVDSIDDGSPVSLSAFKGKKAYLVVNVASQCGLTNKNYAELQDLYEKLRLVLQNNYNMTYFLIFAVVQRD